MSINVTDLKFEKITSKNHPHVICNCCGEWKNPEGGYTSRYLISDKSHVTFFICSDSCVIDFHAQKNRIAVNKLINETILECLRNQRGK